MRILGIDPGSVKLGYGLIEAGPKYVECGVITAPQSWTRAKRLNAIAIELAEVIDEFKPDEIAIETPFMGKNAATAIALGEVRGAILLMAAHVGLEPVGYAPA